MARTNRRSTSKKTRISSSRVSIEKPSNDKSLFEKLQTDLTQNQSYLNLILGSLIVIVIGILIFNYFNKPSGIVGPSGTTENQNESGDVSKENLPGNYTVKSGDTLYLIAQNYYGDGEKYPEIIKANNLTDENKILEGQVLMIPKPGQELAQASPSVSPSTAPASTQPEASQSPPENAVSPEEKGGTPGTGGAVNETIWGEKITGTLYTVVAGDWLSKISGRAYGDIYQFEKIAKENNISNPDLIEPGTVIKIPR